MSENPESHIDNNSSVFDAATKPITFQLLRGGLDHVRGVIEDYQDNISVKNLSDDVYLKCQQAANLYQMFWKYVFSIEDNTTGQTRYPSFLEIKGRINDLRGQLNLSEEMEMGRLFEDCAESVISYIDNRLRLEQTYNINRDIPQQGSEL